MQHPLHHQVSTVFLQPQGHAPKKPTTGPSAPPFCVSTMLEGLLAPKVGEAGDAKLLSRMQEPLVRGWHSINVLKSNKISHGQQMSKFT